MPIPAEQVLRNEGLSHISFKMFTLGAITLLQSCIKEWKDHINECWIYLDGVGLVVIPEDNIKEAIVLMVARKEIEELVSIYREDDWGGISLCFSAYLDELLSVSPWYSVQQVDEYLPVPIMRMLDEHISAIHVPPIVEERSIVVRGLCGYNEIEPGVLRELSEAGLVVNYKDLDLELLPYQ